MTQHASRLNAFAHDTSGAFAILFGLSVAVLFMLVGLAVDSSRAYNVSFKVQDGLDAAALAAAKLLDDPSASLADVQARGESYLKTYIETLRINGVTTDNIRVVPNYSTSSVTVSADVSIRTMLGELSQVATFDFTPTSTVVYKPKKIELAMVLDITGSMCNVPPAWPRDACLSGEKIDALKSAAVDLVEMFAAGAPGKDAVRISVVPYSASVNAGSYAGAVSNGDSTDGCVIERTGVEAYTDAAPLGARALGTTTTAKDPVYSCPSSSVLPLTDVSDNGKKQIIIDHIRSLRGHGGTAGHIGAAWGWYAVSPNWSGIWPSESQPRAYDPDKTVKVVILMTDGLFNAAYRNGGEKYSWPDTSSSDPTRPGTSGYQALKICKNMRAADSDVKVYTIGFQTPPAAESLLKDCSGADSFYPAANVSQLTAAFRDVARRLSSMRVSS